MSRSSAGFGTRQGGLTQSYRSDLAARSRLNSGPAKPAFTPPTHPSQLWAEPPMGTMPSDPTSLYGLKHPVFMRWVSAGIDGFILILLTLFTMFAFDSIDGGLNGGSEILLLENGPLTLIVAALWFSYGLLFESSSWQGTPGKKLTGLVITDMSGQKIGFGKALGRAFGKVVSTIVPLYIPYIMVGMTERKQSLHDKMCGTLVFRRSDLANSNAIFD